MIENFFRTKFLYHWMEFPDSKGKLVDSLGELQRVFPESEKNSAVFLAHSDVEAG